MSPLYQLIAGAMKDPLEKNRKCYILCLDRCIIFKHKVHEGYRNLFLFFSTKIRVQKPREVSVDSLFCVSCNVNLFILTFQKEAQKRMWSHHGQKHCVVGTNLTTPDGDAASFSELANSISPAHGLSK